MMVPVAFLSSLVYIVLSWRVSNAQVLLHFRLFPVPELAAISAGLNILALIGFFTIAGLAITRRKGGESELAASIPISLTPSNIFLGFLVLAASMGLLENQIIEGAASTLYIVAHIWQLGSLASVLVSSKGVSWSRALIPAILVSYLSLVLNQHFT
jgi:hypothetical protein